MWSRGSGFAAAAPIERSGVVRRDPAFGELAQDLFATLGLTIGLGLRGEAQRADHRVKARSHGRVAHPQLALDVFEVPSGFDERLQELQLLRGELVETTERERPLDARAARGAFQTRDAERFGADRAFRDHRVRHEPKMLACLIKCQDKLSNM